MALTRSLPIQDKDFRASTIVSSRSKYYTDIDLSFDVKPGPSGVSLSGDVYKKTDIASVYQSLKNLLLTNRFEKPFNPEFGSDISSLLFENISDYTSSDIQQLLLSTVNTYEPRVNIIEINTDFVNADGDNAINVNIVFSIINTEDTFSFATTLNRLR